MRYSEVLEHHYKIQFSEQSDRDLVDMLFSSAAHHFHMCRTARLKDSQHLRFHERQFLKALACLKDTIASEGEFTGAYDPDGRLWEPDDFNPYSGELICNFMFDSMNAVPGYSLGQSLVPNDAFLYDKIPHLTD